MTVQESLVETYVAHLVNSLGRPVSLEGIKVVVDCANGAAYQAAPAAFEAQGAEVHRIHAEPDGININENCGSTHMDSLRSTVLEQRADIGSHLMGTPIAVWQSTRSAGSSMATRSWRSWLSPFAKRADSRTTPSWPP